MGKKKKHGDKKCGCGVELVYERHEDDIKHIYICPECKAQYAYYIKDGKVLTKRPLNKGIPPEMKVKMPQTLCWKCQRSFDPEVRCSWAKEFKPVEGWEAEKRLQLVRGYKTKSYSLESYMVYKCPLYMHDGRS